MKRIGDGKYLTGVAVYLLSQANSPMTEGDMVNISDLHASQRKCIDGNI